VRHLIVHQLDRRQKSDRADFANHGVLRKLFHFGLEVWADVSLDARDQFFVFDNL
jgi:hypothetical protein